jgi:predicted 3-demethylubiquinone-9 3-methyltransferase (glyoxalase superfamily)
MATPRQAASNKSNDAGVQTKAQKITTFLWFDTQAEEAVKFYISVFKNAKITKTVLYGDSGPRPKGTVMVIDFELDGQKFTALNGGPEFKFNESISLVVNCKTQEEIDYFWEKLSQGGQKIECGWLKDKYGLAWQIVPEALEDLLSEEDPEKTNRVMKEVMKMKKLDLKKLQQAAAGK